jgi:guanylate kinase
MVLEGIEAVFTEIQRSFVDANNERESENHGVDYVFKTADLG